MISDGSRATVHSGTARRHAPRPSEQAGRQAGRHKSEKITVNCFQFVCILPFFVIAVIVVDLIEGNLCLAVTSI